MNDSSAMDPLGSHAELTLFLRSFAEQRAREPDSSERTQQAVYHHLHRIARGVVGAGGGGKWDAMEATALLHGFYERVLQVENLEVRDRAHFFAIAARAMQQIVIDQFRRSRAHKRGQGHVVLTLDGLSIADNSHPDASDVLDVETALGKLDREDPRAAAVVRLRFFGGLTTTEIATALEISVPTIEREWRAARAWLQTRLGPSSDQG